MAIQPFWKSFILFFNFSQFDLSKILSWYHISFFSIFWLLLINSNSCHTFKFNISKICASSQTTFKTTSELFFETKITYFSLSWIILCCWWLSSLKQNLSINSLIGCDYSCSIFIFCTWRFITMIMERFWIFGGCSKRLLYIFIMINLKISLNIIKNINFWL